LARVSTVAPVKETKKAVAAEKAAAPAAITTIAPTSSPEETQQVFAAVLASLPQFATYGSLFKSSNPIALTESETEYSVTVTKHVYDEHVVFQFNCTNTIAEQVLENVRVRLDTSVMGNALKQEFLLACDKLPANQPGVTYVSVRKPKGGSPMGRISPTLQFLAKEVDPQTGLPEESGFEDEYPLEGFDLVLSDFVQKATVVNFQEKWDQLGDEFQVVQQFGMNRPTIQAAVNELVEFFGMTPVDKTNQVPKKSKHILLLAGRFVGDVSVMAQVRMKEIEKSGIAIEVTVRSTNDDVSVLIASAVKSS